MVHKEIHSPQNPWFKETKKLLENNRYRKKQQRFVVEGFKEISLALSANYRLLQVAFVPEFISSGEVLERLELSDSIELLGLSSALMSELAVRSESKNVIGIFESQHHHIELKLANNPAILIVESVEKPGNLGAILRTADAAGFDEIWLCDANVDPLHPQVIRNSLGTVFHVNVHNYDFQTCVDRIKELGLKTYSTFMEDSRVIYEVDFTTGFVVVLGTEHDGVSERWRSLSQNIQIPMQGHIDSLNVSVAAAVIMFEAVRQRRK